MVYSMVKSINAFRREAYHNSFVWCRSMQVNREKSKLTGIPHHTCPSLRSRCRCRCQCQCTSPQTGWPWFMGNGDGGEWREQQGRAHAPLRQSYPSTSQSDCGCRHNNTTKWYILHYTILHCIQLLVLFSNFNTTLFLPKPVCAVCVTSHQGLFHLRHLLCSRLLPDIVSISN